ncbi:MAG: LamG-like jellyroll fold domain-containing protein [Verrucomicrobiota bacterium]
MTRHLRPTARLCMIKLAAASWLAGLGLVNALTYHISYLEDEGKRAQITQVMNEAVAVYNATTDINVDINVIYHSGIPTAQADYNGQLGFGGSISTQVAIHEIAHYLGSGTTGEWDARFGGDSIWDGAALKRYVKLFDGPGAEINRSGVHYFPYGFNYGNEDNPTARYRIGRIVRAMRMDMGGQDGDGDGMPDEWEKFKSGSTGLNATGDTDGDGISDYDEWWTDSHPMWACPIKSGHIYQIRSRLSQKLMEAADTTAGAVIRQNPNNGSDLQKWLATYVSGGYWKFTNVASGKCPDVFNFSWDAGVKIIAWNDTGAANQQWRIFPGASGGVYWKIGNRNSTNMVMDVDGGPNATGDNAAINQYFDDLNAFNQDWAFDDVTPGVQTDGLIANYKFEGNGRDYSNHGFHGVASGGITYAAGRVDGQAATFNGTSGSIRVPATVERNFSLACWVKTTATAGAGQWYNGMGIIDADMPGVAKDFGLAMLGNKAAFGVGSPELTITSATAINDGNWHHLAATLDTGNGAMKLYVDGVLSASGTGAAAPRSAPANFYLGSVGGTAGFLNGSLDEARLYNKILSQDEINRLATVGNTLVANYTFDDNTQDISKHGNHGDPVGITYTAGKVGASAVQFNGTGSFVKIPAAVTADFSIAYWVKTTQTGGTGQWWAGKSMVDADIPGVANDWGIALVGDKAGFGIGNAGAGDTILSTTAINNGAWHHVVATRVGATGAMKLYVNGALQASGVGSAALRNAPGGIRLGSTLYGGAYFAGAIDDLKIFNYTLGASQAAALASTLPAPWTAADIGNPGNDGYSGYAAGTGVFTLTGGGTDIAGTSDQFHFLSQAVGGDQIAVTKVNSAPFNTDGSVTTGAKTGLMFRNSAAVDSAFVDVVYNHATGVRFMYRDTAGASAGQVGGNVSVSFPFWLKLARSGNTFTAFYATTASSPAAGDWVSLGSHVTSMVANPLVGVAVTSHNPGQVATSNFGNTTVVPNTPGNAWRLDYFASAANTGNAADAADPDNDGIINLFERAFGLNPQVSNAAAGQTPVANDGTFLRMTYLRSLAATDLQFQVVWSNDLATWSASGITDTLISSTPTTETREAKVPLTTLGADQGFLRLRLVH